MNALNLKNFGLGLLAGFAIMLCLSLTSEKEKESEYHLYYNAYKNKTIVYNATTGEFNDLNWGDLKKGENLKNLLEKDN